MTPSQLDLETPCREWKVSQLVDHLVGGQRWARSAVQGAPALMGLSTTVTFTHAWDLARATGQDTNLDPELATTLLAQSRQSKRLNELFPSLR